jgi:hypothetical protein
MKRSILLSVACFSLMGLCAFLGARAQPASVKLRLRLVDATSGKSLPGIVRIHAAGQEKALPLPGLYDRLRGLQLPDSLWGWHVVPAGEAETTVPAGKIRLEALSGLETALARRDIDLSGKDSAEIVVKLNFLFRPEKDQLLSGNTHLHLMKLSEKDADDYLVKIPAADGLRLLFISYLERFKDDLTYVTNKYPIGDLRQFDATGVLVNNGEEHRHNFKAYGQGYGHVMFLNIKKLVRPVSLGPGITGAGFDDRPLRPGIDDARRQGGTVIWCHNTFGFEDVLNALTGRLHALNVFDGSRIGDYAENYYRYLNIGIRMPLSTGTDWFLYDFSRVYAEVPGKLTVPAWLEAVKAGRCVATNGPLLTLTVDGRRPGQTLRNDEPRKLRIEAAAVGRHDFQQLQLIHNGKVLKTQTVQAKSPYRARLVHEVRIDQPGWFAARIDSTTKNELNRPLYAHTSPVYVDFRGRGIFDVEAAQGLLKLIEEAQEAIRSQGRFSTRQTSSDLLALYNQGAEELRRRINQRK